MADVSSTDQLPIKVGQEYRVKLGKSFTFPKENAYHTIKYDFKPLSVDQTKPGKLRVADDEVNVLLPLVQAESTDDVAQFRGPKKACTKECVLFIDTTSGEAVLERISNTIQLKAIRDGRKPANPRDRSISPSPYPMIQPKPPPPNKPQQSVSSPSLSTHTNTPPSSSGNATTKTHKRPVKSKAKKTPSVKQEAIPQNGQNQLSANGNVDKKRGGKKTTKKSTTVKTESMPAPVQTAPISDLLTTSTVTNVNTGPSMPIFSVTSSQAAVTSNVVSHPIPPDHGDQLLSKRIKLTSMSSSSSSSDSSDSEPDEHVAHASQVISHVTQAPPTQVPGVNLQYENSQFTQLTNMYGGHMTQPGLPIGHRPQQSQKHSSSSSSSGSSDSSSGSSSSDSSSDSSDQEVDKEVASAFNQQQNSLRPRTMSQLRTDLHLSDTGSDSDS